MLYNLFSTLKSWTSLIGHSNARNMIWNSKLKMFCHWQIFLGKYVQNGENSMTIELLDWSKSRILCAGVFGERGIWIRFNFDHLCINFFTLLVFWIESKFVWQSALNILCYLTIYFVVFLGVILFRWDTSYMLWLVHLVSLMILW